ncbi:hypothetical protein C0J52_01756 [Blattella germanica]|nr:hypothetical protein C0J52_01756 [Blattella germanica]
MNRGGHKVIYFQEFIEFVLLNLILPTVIIMQSKSLKMIKPQDLFLKMMNRK